MNWLSYLMALFNVCSVMQAIVYSRRCKWANEGCDRDTDCCSGTCELLHSGTNHRCTKSSIRQPCLFGFHCDSRLKCGRDYMCCAGHWGTCSEKTDCCAHYHVCRKMKGFVYRKCVPRPRTLPLPKSGGQTKDQLIYCRTEAISLSVFTLVTWLA